MLGVLSGHLSPHASVMSVPRRTYCTPLHWQPLGRLRDGSIQSFRQEAFIPAIPVLTPVKHFDLLPAKRKWFLPHENSPASSRLNRAYLGNFRDSLVPLEMTQIMSALRSGATNDCFQRAEAPLGIFLDWAENTTEKTKERIYLAQASIRDLPQVLKDDLPTPDLVVKTAKGDVYDTSIWLGIPPTYTPLHKDPNPNLFIQLAGEKVVRLLPPEAGQEVFTIVQAALGRSTYASFRGSEMMKGEEKARSEYPSFSRSHPNQGIYSSIYSRLQSGAPQLMRKRCRSQAKKHIWPVVMAYSFREDGGIVSRELALASPHP